MSNCFYLIFLEDCRKESNHWESRWSREMTCESYAIKWNKNRNSAARESICSRYLPLISQCGCLKNRCGKFSVMMLIHIIYVVHRETCLASPTNRRRFVRRNATCISRNCLRNCRFENVCVHIYVRIKRCRLAWEKLFDCNCTAQRMLDESIFACYNVGQR